MDSMSTAREWARRFSRDVATQIDCAELICKVCAVRGENQHGDIQASLAICPQRLQRRAWYMYLCLRFRILQRVVFVYRQAMTANDLVPDRAAMAAPEADRHAVDDWSRPLLVEVSHAVGHGASS